MKVALRFVFCALFFFIVGAPHLNAADKNVGGGNMTRTVNEMRPEDSPINLWAIGFRHHSFHPQTLESGGFTIAFFETAGKIGTDNVRFVFNIFPYSNLRIRDEVDTFYANLQKSAPAYSTRTKKFRVRGGAGRRSVNQVNGCEFMVAAIDKISTVVSLEACGDARPKVIDMFANVRGTTKGENLASIAKVEGGTPIQADLPKPAQMVECENSKGNSDRMAAFMKGLPDRALSQFLSAGQDCAVFSRG
ncbi:MAG: hypothetical protein HQ495_07225 [Alphaproteobacteria bacterium]|nr:hypothetical protein [Alphaproteobacteria bacterium]